MVKTSSGIWPFNRKSAGLYYSNGSSWNYMSPYPDLLKDSNFGIQNGVDPTRMFRFSATDIPTSTTVIFTVPSASGTLALTSDIPAPVDISGKVDKITGYSLISDNDIIKLSEIQSGAEVNVNADWNATEGDAVILNKPSIPVANNYINGVAIIDFADETNISKITINSSVITSANIKNFSYICIETDETSLDDFSLNGVTFNIENIIDNTSFDIRGTALNSATGNYTINYKITY